MVELDLTEDAARAMIDAIEKAFPKLPPTHWPHGVLAGAGIDVSGLPYLC